MGGVTIKLEGVGDVTKAFDELAQEIGDKKARSKILIPAARDAMRPVLAMAQQLAPVDTGVLRLLLQVEARRPNSRDKRSKYINSNDAVIATITTASGKKMKAMSEGKGLIAARRRMIKLGASREQAMAFEGFGKNEKAIDRLIKRGATRDEAEAIAGVESDARAIAQEFGTAKMAAKPYLRPALESQSQQTVDRLAEAMRKYMTKFRAKT